MRHTQILSNFLAIIVLLLAGCGTLNQAPPDQAASTPSSNVETIPETRLVPVPRIESTATAAPATATASQVSPEPFGPPAPLLEDPAQAAALLPEFRGDLASLRTANHYTIQLSLDDANHAFHGSSQVDYTNSHDLPLDHLYFRLFPNGHKSYGSGSLRVNQVTLDGQPLQTALSLSDTVLEVTLPRPLGISETARLDFDFDGVVPENFGGGKKASGYGIYNLSQNVLSLSGWYPILAVYDQQGWNLTPVSYIGDSVYSETAFYTVDVTADPDLVLAATGVALEHTVQDNYAHYHFVSGPVRDFTLVASPDFKVASQKVNGTQVNSYYLTGHEAGGKKALTWAVDSLRVYGQDFGLYPFTELDVVDAPLNNAGGVEYPSIVLIGDHYYENANGQDILVATAHEVAHQWWYSLVGNDVIHSPWLDEALTTYSSSLIFEDVYGKQGYQGFLSHQQDRYDELVKSGKDNQVTQSLGYFESLNDPGVYSNVVYTKGSLFFAALRREIGDEAFFIALKNYYRDEKYRVAQPADLLLEFEKTSVRSLENFYQTWLYSPKK